MRRLVREIASGKGLNRVMPLDGSVTEGSLLNTGKPEISAGHHTPSLKRKDRHGDKEFNMVDFLIMSLLVTLCLEQNPVHLTGPTTGLEVVTSRTTSVVYDGRLFGQSVKR